MFYFDQEYQKQPPEHLNPYKKEYPLSEVKEVRIRPFLGNSLFKVEFKGEIFLVVKYTWSYEKAKKIGNAINLTTGLPIKDEV